MNRTKEYSPSKTYEVMRKQRALRLMGIAVDLGRDWIEPDDVIIAKHQNLEDDRAVEAQYRGEGVSNV